MDSQIIPPGPASEKRSVFSQKTPWICASILFLSFYISFSFEYSTRFLDGLIWWGTFGSLGLIPLFAGCYFLTLWVIRRIPRALILILVIVLSTAILGNGIVNSRPISRFEFVVLSPAPESLRNLYVRCMTSFNDGDTWFFRFTIDEEDFEAICRERKLEAIPYNLEERRARLAEFESHGNLTDEDREHLRISVFPEDWNLALIFRDEYRRPTRPEYFKSRKMTAVRDPDTDEVSIIYFTRLRDVQ